MLRRGTAIALLHRLSHSKLSPLVTLTVIVVLSFLEGSFNLRYSVVYSLEALSVAILILQLITHAGNWPWRRLETRPVRYLGMISYSLYLWQQLALDTARRLTTNFPVVVQLLFAIVVTIAFAATSYHFVGKPFLRLKQRLEDRARSVLPKPPETSVPSPA